MVAEARTDQIHDGELDAGPQARAPERLCVATREVRPIGDLIRFVVGPDGEAVPDVKSKLPGRGVWVTATQRGAGRGDQAQGLRPRLQARRAAAVRPYRPHRGAAGTGRDRCAGRRRQGRFGGDRLRQGRGGARPRRRGRRAARGGSCSRGRAQTRRRNSSARRSSASDAAPAMIRFLTAAQLDLALNRPNVIHAAVLAGPASETFLARCRRLEKFRAGDQHQQAGQAAPNLSRPRI